jgi:2-oxoglutarate dehydrogenase E2 component (dihydrolipoamide succinyltransferase)
LTSPVVRRLLAEHGLDAADVTGTGPGGRVTRKDVLDAVEARGAGTPVAAPGAPVAAPTPAPSVAPAPAVAPPVVESAETAGTVVPMSVIRKRIAEHMVRSQAASAHAYVSVEVDFERVAIVRAAHRDAWRACEGFSLTYLPFIARAVSDCIDDYPVVNASIDGESLVLHPALHLAIAVDLAFEGLIAPVIRDADGKRLRQIAREVNDLATRARAKQLNPDEVQGGTFTITNPGPYGTYQTLAIINQPQVAILATDGITKQARVVEGVDGADVIAIRHTGLLTLGWDHRAFDGAYAAAFLNAMRDVLEHRDWETELE